MKVFLSAVSCQFKACRDALASDLRAIGCEVKVQEDFQQGAGNLIAQIESYVAQCDRVIAVVGDAYGADAVSDAIPVGKPPRSYTQWEYYFAIGERLRGPAVTPKDLYVYMASANYLTSNPVPQPDEPRGRQQQFIEAIKQSGKHRSNFDSLDQLCRSVLRDGWQMNERPVVPRPPLQLPNRALAGKLFGRNALLSQLVDRLKRREHIDIWGPAGMGKTALAAEAILQVIGNDTNSLAASPFPDGVVLLDLYRLKFASPDPAWHHVANSFDATVPTTMQARERATRACHGRRALVIVEGAEEAVDGSRLKELLSVLSQETVRLVLTRNKSQVSTAKPFNVEAELEREEAFALLREFWQEGRDETVIVLIYHRFGGHPLALTWAGSQLNAAEESPNAFVQALNATTLPAITEPGYEKHTLPWLYQRSVSHFSCEARRVLAAAGLLAQQAFPLDVALAVLPSSNPGQAREALKQLVRYGILRISAGADEWWEFTHALTHQFAHAATDLSLLAPLGDWVVAAFDQAVVVAKTTSDFSPLGQALAHSSALLSADHNADFLEALAIKLRYGGDDTLRALGRLDLVRAANAADRGWLLSADADHLTTSSWQYELVVSYNKLGDVDWATGNLDAAHAAFEKALKICGRLAEAYRGHNELSWRLAALYSRLGDVALGAGNLEYALAVYSISSSVFNRLAEADPSNSQWQRDLSISYEKLGEIDEFNGNLDRARDYYEKCLVIRTRLAQADPSNNQWQLDLAISNERLGKIAMSSGKVDDARHFYDQRMHLTENVATADPANAEFQRELSVSYANIGTVFSADKRNSEALAYFQKSLKISHRLAILDPSNAIWRNDLGWIKSQIVELKK